jgi:hypothetical protein
VTEEYRPLSGKSLVMSGEICAPPFNPGPVFFRGDDGSDVPWIAGETHFVERCDVSAVFVKGQAGSILTLVGGTW